MTWGVWDASIFSLQPKIILGADVLYDTSGRIFTLHYVLICFLLNFELKYGFHLCRKAFDDLFATVKFLLQNSPGSVFITTYHNRRYFCICFGFDLISLWIMCTCVYI